MTTRKSDSTSGDGFTFLLLTTEASVALTAGGRQGQTLIATLERDGFEINITASVHCKRSEAISRIAYDALDCLTTNPTQPQLIKL